MTSTTMPRPVRGGRHALQIPGPTNTPGPVLRAIAQPTIDHRGPEFAALERAVLRDFPPGFGTSAPAVRSAERRVGEAFGSTCRSRWPPNIKKKQNKNQH